MSAPTIGYYFLRGSKGNTRFAAQLFAMTLGKRAVRCTVGVLKPEPIIVEKSQHKITEGKEPSGIMQKSCRRRADACVDLAAHQNSRAWQNPQLGDDQLHMSLRHP
jgi:hypothetical protein